MAGGRLGVWLIAGDNRSLSAIHQQMDDGSFLVKLIVKSAAGVHNAIVQNYQPSHGRYGKIFQGRTHVDNFAIG
mgnify:CR=1 FL=1